MNIVDGTGRTITGATLLTRVEGPGRLFLVKLSDDTTRLVGRTQVIGER